MEWCAPAKRAVVETAKPAARVTDEEVTAGALSVPTDEQFARISQSLLAEMLAMAARGMPAPLVPAARGTAIETAKVAVLAVFAGPTGPLPHLSLVAASFGGHDVSGVRAHQGPAAAAVARAFDARAVAVGEHVLFAGAPDLHTVAHEAAHVVQQRAGIAPGAEHEAHADAVADQVVRGRSAAALLARFRGGGGSPVVQAKGASETGANTGEDSQLVPGHTYSTLPGAYGVAIDTHWYLATATPGASGRMQDLAKNREILEAMRAEGRIAWATNAGIAAAAAVMGVRANAPAEVQLYFAADVMGRLGLPPGAPAMVTRMASQFSVAIAFDVKEATGTMKVTGAGVASIYAALDGFTGLTSDPSRYMTAFELDVGSGAVYGFIGFDACAAVYGAGAWAAWLAAHRLGGAAAAGRAGTGVSTIRIPLTPDEQAWLRAWASSTFAHGGDAVALTRDLFTAAKAVDASPYREQILAALHSDAGSAHVLDGEAVSAVMHDTVFEARRQEASKDAQVSDMHAFGHATNESKYSKPLVDAELPASIHVGGDLVADGDAVPFGVAIDWARSPIPQTLFDQRRWTIEVDWSFRAGGAHEFVRGMPSGTIDHRLRLLGDAPSTIWTVQAFVRTSHFQPTALAPVLVEVKSQRDRLDSVEADALGNPDTLAGFDRRVHDVDIGTVDDSVSDYSDDHGLRFHGAMPFAPRTAEQRALDRSGERKRLEATLAYLRSHPGRYDDAIAEIEASLARRDEDEKTIAHAEKVGAPFEVRASYYSRQPGSPSGPLAVSGVATYKMHGITVTLYDTSRIASDETIRVTNHAGSFEQALEASFVDLCKEYPNGTVSVFAEELDSEGPTGQMVGFELTTSSGVKRAKEVVFSPVANAIMGVLSMICAPLAALGTLYFAVESVSTMVDHHRVGQLHGKKLAVDAANLGMSALGAIRAAVPAGRFAALSLTASVLGKANLVLVMAASTADHLRALDEGDVAVVSQMVVELLELEKTTYPSDPKLDEKRQAIRSRAEAAGKNLSAAFGEAIADNAFMLVQGGLEHVVAAANGAPVVEETLPAHDWTPVAESTHEADPYVAAQEAAMHADEMRAPGAVDHAGQRVAQRTGGVVYAGEGQFTVETAKGPVEVEVVRTKGAKESVAKAKGKWVVKVGTGGSAAEFEQAVIGKLAQVRATVEGGKGAAAVEAGQIAELRMLREQGGTEALQRARAVEAKLGMGDPQRRAEVEAQIEVQADAPRRMSAAKELEGEHGHPGIELHTHFTGIVDAEVFRVRAAQAAGGDPQSWVPLLDKLASLPQQEFNQQHANGEITQREKAGDAIDIVREAQKQVRTLAKRLDKANPADVAAYKQAIQAVAEEACTVALSATPETTFDGAYEVRDQLIKDTFAPGKEGRTVEDAYDDYTREAVLKLAQQGVKYVEASTGIKKVGGVLSPARVEAVIDQLVAEGKLQPGQVDVRMLSMMLTGRFGEREVGLPAMGKPDRDGADAEADKIAQQVAEQGSAGGDVGGPEAFTWDKYTAAQFVRFYEKLLAQAKALGHAVVLRPHVGEGAVDTVDGKPFNTDKSRVITNGEPSHYARAENNIGRFLEAMEQLQQAGQLDNASVIVRMGHVTHATPDQAMRMQALGIVGEVNLYSNVATGSVSQTEGAYGPRSKTERFQDHSFLTLVYYDVPIALSTDGNAVMGTTMAEEYQRAKTMIEDVLAGRTKVLVRATDAQRADGSYRGTATAGGYELAIADMTPDERSRFMHGYEKMFADAETYYLRRPDPRGGAHHVDIARHGGLQSALGTAVFEGTLEQVRAAADGYRDAGYTVTSDDNATFVVTTRAADFTTVLRPQ